MELADTGFTAINVGSDFERPEDVTEYFTLHAPPNTNIWRKPSAMDDATAPMVLKRLQQSFILAEVTVSADFAMEFDQAGLVIFAGARPDQSSRSAVSRRTRPYTRRNSLSAMGKWVKAGLEFTGGEIHATSVVATSSCGADWCSSARLPPRTANFDPYPSPPPSLRVKFERVDGSLWIWYQMPDSSLDPPAVRSPADVGSEWKKMREVMGFFNGREEKGEIWVGCYASRPMDFEPSNSWEELDNLVAEFEDLDIL